MAVTALIIAAFGRNTAIKGFIRPDQSDPNPVTKTFDPGQYVVKLDATLSEGFEKTASLTKSQIEDGATVSDHVTANPDKLSIEAIVSDTPVSLRGVGSFVSSRLSQDAFTALEKMAEDRIPFTFVGGFKVYKNMVFTKFNPVRNSKTGAILHFTATLEEVRFVGAVVEQATRVKVHTAKPKDLGNQQLFPLNNTQSAVVDATGNDLTARAF